MCKNVFEGNIPACCKFSCMHSSHDLCAHAHVHSLERTLLTIMIPTIPVILVSPILISVILIFTVHYHHQLFIVSCQSDFHSGQSGPHFRHTKLTKSK